MPDKRFLITIGSPETQDSEFLPRVEADVNKMSDFFTNDVQQYQQVLTKQIPLGSKSSTIREHIASWFAEEKRKSSDHVIIYVAGHATDKFGQFDQPCLLSVDSNRNNPLSIIKLNELVGLLFDGLNERPNNVLLILDVCYAGKLSGKAIGELALNTNSSLEKGCGFFVVSSSTSEGKAYDGTFIEAFFSVINDEAWQPAGDYFSIGHVVEGMNVWFDSNKVNQRSIYAVNGAQRADRFIKVQKKSILSNEIIDFSYWDLKARGVDFAGTKDWFFTGRVNALKEIAQWLSSKKSQYRIWIVTGDPGSGKSAVLSRLALSAAASTRSSLIKELALDNNDPTLPPANSVSVCFNARGMRLEDIVDSISKQLKLKVKNKEELVQAIKQSGQHIGIIIDSLDETKEPTRILNELIFSLVDIEDLRLIVGSRRINLPSINDAIKVIDLDSREYFSSKDILNYVRLRLAKRLELGGNSEQDKTTISLVAEMVAEKAGHSFLYARLVSRSIEDSISKLNVSEKNWHHQLKLPDSLSEAFTEDLKRFDSNTRRKIFDLLIPLAYAKGKGLPFKNVWRTVASYVADTDYSNQDISELLNVAGYYIVRDVENEEAVYRLFHQAFADYLKQSTKDQDVEHRFVNALVRLRGKNDEGKSLWKETKEPYILKYFAAHASEAKDLDRFILDLDFLVNYPSQNIIPFIQSMQSEEAWRAARAYKRSSHYLSTDPNLFLAQLYSRAYEYNAYKLIDNLKSLNKTLPWFPSAASWDIDFSNYVICRAEDHITAIDTFLVEDLGPLAVCGYSDGSIKLWKLSDGQLYGSYIMPELPKKGYIFTHSVSYVGLGIDASGAYILVAWRYAIAVYSISNRKSLKEAHVDFPITAFKLQNIKDSLFLFTAHDGEDKEESNSSIITWSVPDLNMKQQRRSASKSSISSLGVARYQSKPVLVSAGDSFRNGEQVEKNLIKIWSCPDLKLKLELLDLDGGYVGKINAFNVGNDLWILATSTSRRTLLCNADGDDVLEFNEARYGGITDILGMRIDGNIVQLMGRSYSEILMYTVSFVPEADIQKHEVKMRLSEFMWAPSIMINGRLSLINADVSQLRIWDFEEIWNQQYSKKALASNVYNLEGDYYVSFVQSSNCIITATQNKKLVSWDADLKFKKETVCGFYSKHMVVGETKKGQYIIIGDGTHLYNIDPDTMEVIDKIALEMVGDIHHIEQFWWDGKSYLLVCANSTQPGTTGNYAARVWSCDPFTELDTREGEIDRYKFQIGAYRDKTLTCASFIQSDLGPWIVMAGPGGRCEVRDFQRNWWENLIDQFQLGDYHDVCCVGKLVFDQRILVGIGKTNGEICIRDLRTRAYVSSEKVKIHDGGISKIIFRVVNEKVVIVTAGYDRKIHFWTKELRKIYTLDIDHSVVDVIFDDSETLLVLCGSGIVKLKLNLNEILKEMNSNA